VTHAGKVVSKSDLIARVWPGVTVDDGALRVQVAALRKALRDGQSGARYVITLTGQGYCFVAPVSRFRTSGSPPPESPTLEHNKLPSRLPRIADPRSAQVAAETFSCNLPVAGSDLIGRTAAVQQVRDLLSARRVVTLTGPGGIGKTRLAIEAARGELPSSPGEGSLVELASISDPNLLPSAVASTLGFKLGGDEISPESVARAIGARKLLLVLDNCEHLIESAAILVELVVRLCPHTRVLATSRELLRVEGEYVYRVPPLEVPSCHQGQSDDVIEHSAIRLFIARMGALRKDFLPDRDDLSVVAAICRRLDGIPLAIEFAAARASTLGVQGVASRLDDRFKLLTDGRRTALPRHQTLRATLDWSYELLPEPERHLLRRLAVFTAGFTLEAATAVASDDPGFATTVLEGLANLVAKSLVAMDRSATTERWRLLETIREYAIEKLAESDETELAARRHAEFFRDIFAPAATAAQLQPSIENMERYGREIDNVRTALDWSFSPTGDTAIGIILAAAYAPVWLHLALMVECRERTECALRHLDRRLNESSRQRMQLNIALGVALVFTMGSVTRTRAVLVDALEIAQKLDDVEAQLRVLWALWALQFNIGECRDARSITKLFFQAARRTGDQAAVLVADRIIGATLQYEGNQPEARRCFERVLNLYVAPKDQRHTIWFHYDQPVLARAMLARSLWLQGFLDQAADQAQRSLQEAATSSHELSLLYPIAWSVYPIAVMTGDFGTAAQVVPRLIDLAVSYNSTFWKILGHCLQGKLLIKQGQFREGSAQLRTALEVCDKSGWTVCYPEFLGVLAEGLAGLGEIAEALFIMDQALQKASEGGECWYVAELLRLKGELLLQQLEDRSVPAAEACFRDAREVARKQDALFWELRVALSLTDLRMRQNRKADARKVLAPVYDLFTEGFGTADLRAARAMLESLPPG
jgi:predicted ATPase